MVKTFTTLVFIFLLTGCQPNPPQTPEKPNPPSETTNQFNLPSQYQHLTIPGLKAKSHPGSPIKISEPHQQNIDYTSHLSSYQSDGFQINALLTLPTSDQPPGGWPAIVFSHGFVPPTQYSTTTRYQDYVDTLAKNGFVVFKIDLRGHGQSEGQPSGAYFSGDYVSDILNAYASLEQLDQVNPNKTGLWGHSMSGNLVLRAMTAKPEIPAGVIWAGAVYSYQDFLDYRITDYSFQRQVDYSDQIWSDLQSLFDIVGQLKPNHPFWQQVAPTNYLDQNIGAIQLHHAANDPVVNIGYSKDLAIKLKANNITHQLHEYPTGGHNLTGPSFTTAMQRTIDFFNQHL